MVTVTTKEDYLANLTEMLRRMPSAGMQLKCDKFVFMLSQVHFLGHTMLSKGIPLTQDKICAIRDAPAPTDLHQLKSLLGLFNF